MRGAADPILALLLLEHDLLEADATLLGLQQVLALAIELAPGIPQVEVDVVEAAVRGGNRDLQLRNPESEVEQVQLG